MGTKWRMPLLVSKILQTRTVQTIQQRMKTLKGCSKKLSNCSRVTQYLSTMSDHPVRVDVIALGLKKMEEFRKKESCLKNLCLC